MTVHPHTTLGVGVGEAGLSRDRGANASPSSGGEKPSLECQAEQPSPGGKKRAFSPHKAEIFQAQGLRDRGLLSRATAF